MQTETDRQWNKIMNSREVFGCSPPSVCLLRDGGLLGSVPDQTIELVFFLATVYKLTYLSST
jgi:hypothetical protein